jgi:AcrR family transcriptional regulator
MTAAKAPRGTTTTDPRPARHEAMKLKILREAWKLAARDGLSGFSLGDLAKKVGLRQPSLYTYFDSKLGLYDAMFEHGNQQLWDSVATRGYGDDPRTTVKEIARGIVEFYSEDVTRAQLLFQRPVPGFEPSRKAYAPAVRFFEWARTRLAEAGIVGAEEVDKYTAIVAGLADQQSANDPGGDRWLRLVDEVIEMLLDRVVPTTKTKKRRS